MKVCAEESLFLALDMHPNRIDHDWLESTAEHAVPPFPSYDNDAKPIAEV